MRWLLSSLMQSIFLLGMSVFCYYVQLAKAATNVPLHRDQILDLLRNTYLICISLSAVSQDARRAVEHLSLVLGLPHQQDNSPFTDNAWVALWDTSHIQDAWNAYDGELICLISTIVANAFRRHP